MYLNGRTRTMDCRWGLTLYPNCTGARGGRRGGRGRHIERGEPGPPQTGGATKESERTLKFRRSTQTCHLAALRVTSRRALANLLASSGNYMTNHAVYSLGCWARCAIVPHYHVQTSSQDNRSKHLQSTMICGPRTSIVFEGMPPWLDITVRHGGYQAY